MSSAQTQTEHNKELIRRMFDEVWNKRQIAAIETFYAPALVEGTTAFVSAYFAAFADWQFTITAIIAEGDQIAVRWRNTGTHQGDYLGIPATGKRVAFEGMGLQRITDGKIVADEGFWDELTIQRALGQDTL